MTVRFISNLFKIDVISELHLFRVNLQDLHSSDGVWNADVDFPVESAESSESRVNRVGSVCCAHDNDVCALLQSVHESEQLRDNSPLDLAVCFVSLGGDGIDLVDEDDRRCVLLGFFECLSQVRLGLAGHFGHNFRPVDEEEKRASLVSDCSSDQSFTSSGRAKQKNTTGSLDTNGFEEPRMTKWELNHFSNLRHLFSAASDVVISN